MEIRRARAHDRERLHPLLEQLIHADPVRRRAASRAAFADPDYAAWVAAAGGKAVGFVDVFVFSDVAHGGRIAVVNNLVVDAEFRGRGIGGRLMRQAMQHCRRRRVVEAHVWTGRDNARAIGLYTGCGFVDRGVLLEREL